ncbi:MULTISPECIES: hypothetical protein [Pandoraea]|uniref:hypothetical protein n=1 Tax=Pandoraea TaxID=93217 RepID=UPI001F5CD07D|nr:MULTISPECIES: hypothetical protein [Pandoraea]MCI3205856.1 hypothetical protein [Pandoraea sp. LA3]MDN4583884.1 hypothetical protein [Pandoraea capi]
MSAMQRKVGRTGLASVAGVWCDSPDFHAWLEELAGQPFTKADAVEFIYLACEIQSRSELDTDERAARLFVEKIRRPFREWLGGKPAAPAPQKRNK